MLKKKILEYLSYISIAALMYLLLGLCLLFIFKDGFGPGVADYEYSLSGDYRLVRSSAHNIKVIPYSIYQSTTPIIPAKVTEIAWDNQYILAKRQGLKKASNDPQISYLEPDRSVEDYWILDTSIPQVYGPMPTEEFKRKRLELNISDNLILQPVYKYKVPES